MHRKPLFQALLVLLLASPATAADSPSWPLESRPLTLSDCYTLALRQSEIIAVRQELIQEAEARFTQALSGILPRVSFVSSDKRQDGAGGSLFTLRHIPERKFTLSQPLFRGFKEFSAMAVTKAERRQRAHEKVRAEQLLFLDVADAFYLLLEQREDLQALEVIRQALLERLEELKARERLGRSRPSEVVSAQARLRRLEAEQVLVKSQETVTRQLLEFLTGQPKIEAVTDPLPDVPVTDPEETFLAKSMMRPDVHAAEDAAAAAEKQIGVARADTLPSVNLDGNYYVERAGVSKDVSWDAEFKVEVPIFQGGQNLGAVRESSSKARQAKWQLAETRRRAVLEIRDAHAEVIAAVARRAALARALDASDENYRFQTEDYRRSLVNNLEVLQALQDLQDSRRDLLHAHYEVKRLYWRLKVAAGDITP